MSSNVVAAGAALDTLIHQFSDPLSFYREMVQNSLDAGSPRVDINVREEAGQMVVSVEDWGKGMTAEVIDTQLTRLFSGHHGFVFQIPREFLDGSRHSVYAYGLDTDNKTGNPELSGSPAILL